MKKGWKIFWIVCAGIAGLGVVLAIVGGVMGATFGNVQTALWQYGNHAEQKVEQLENRLDLFDDDYYDDDYYDDDYYDAYDDLGEGNVGAGYGGNLFANAGTGDDVVIVNTAGIYELDVDVCDLQVEIQENAEEGEIVFQRENIPEEVREELVLIRDDAEKELKVDIRNEKHWRQVMKNRGEVGSLIIQIPNALQLNTIKLSIGDGVLNADYIQAKEVDIEVGAGVIDLTQFAVDSIDIEVGAGEVHVAGTALREAGIDCGIGTVDYQAAGSETDYSYDVEVGAGVVRIGDTEYSGIAGGKQIMNGGVLMEIDCGVGEVNLDFTGA